MLTKRHVIVNGSQIYVVEAVPSTPSAARTVVLVPGLGASHAGYLPVFRLLPSTVHAFSYDRLGVGQSDRTTIARPAAVLAQELKATLVAAEVPGPYLLVLSSYAGIIGREFLEAFDSDVAGIVYVDANQEKSQVERKWPIVEYERTVGAVFGTNGPTGIAQGHKCTQEEWAVIQAEEARGAEDRAKGIGTGNEGEWQLYEPSLLALGEHKQLDRQALGARPISVIQANLVRDFQRGYDAARAQGKGTPEDCRLIEDFCERLPAVELRMNSEVLKLSSVHRMIITSLSGHCVTLWEPELVVQEILWCLEHI